MTVQATSPAATHVIRIRRRPRLTAGRVLGTIAKYTLLVVLSISFILPLYWMAMSALKNLDQVFVIPPVWFPIPPRWVNYIEAWQFDNFSLYTVNTVLRYAIPVTIGSVLSNVLVAYGFSRIYWRGRDVLF